ncbi:hypothetical protein FACS1894116_10910 [Betaproteobacteria bacterium]|nr:hypothetical protein FACS1894116_10910 [Betaproteobacteria bacterium]GHT99772.1 hypothetical protein FACS1894154_07520 [Betaproteobacteria bacterium]GHU25534.1 hypothetical protein FACS189488_12810 [Betaproteobacteria bacterium]GHU30582.1 hypothetical protein FACS189497_10500 [Betaproteobacteria bacterium]
MPQLIGTPEQWFRTKGSDYFAIRLSEEVENVPAELQEWFAQYFPHRPLTTLGPSEHSGYILGGPVEYAFEMDENDLKVWCERWEDSIGDSIDPRWQCYQYPYQRWLARFDRIQTTAGVPPAGTSCRWFLCNVGVFWLTGRYFKSESESGFSVPSFDDWWIIRQRFPELSIGEDEIFMMGTIFYRPTESLLVVVEEYKEKDGDLDYAWRNTSELEEEAIDKRIRAALALSEDTKITHGFF